MNRTKFPTSVLEMAKEKRNLNVIKPAINNFKLSEYKHSTVQVQNSPFFGYEMGTITLEERATCNPDCIHFDSEADTPCYGDNMHRAKRYIFDTQRFLADIDRIMNKRKVKASGFLLRNNILGDFHSIEQVEAFITALDRYENLVIFGYTRTYGKAVDIRLEQSILSLSKHDRYYLWFSGLTVETEGLYIKAIASNPSALSDRNPLVPEMDDRNELFTCPAQRNDKAINSCAACGICFNPSIVKNRTEKSRNLLFITH